MTRRTRSSSERDDKSEDERERSPAKRSRSTTQDAVSQQLDQIMLALQIIIEALQNGTQGNGGEPAIFESDNNSGDSDKEDHDETSPKPVRVGRGHRFSDEQIRELQIRLEEVKKRGENRFSPEEVSYLREQTKLTNRQIKDWCYTQFYKERKEISEETLNELTYCYKLFGKKRFEKENLQFVSETTQMTVEEVKAWFRRHEEESRKKK